MEHIAHECPSERHVEECKQDECQSPYHNIANTGILSETGTYTTQYLLIRVTVQAVLADMPLYPVYERHLPF